MSQKNIFRQKYCETTQATTLFLSLVKHGLLLKTIMTHTTPKKNNVKFFIVMGTRITPTKIKGHLRYDFSSFDFQFANLCIDTQVDQSKNFLSKLCYCSLKKLLTDLLEQITKSIVSFNCLNKDQKQEWMR